MKSEAAEKRTRDHAADGETAPNQTSSRSDSGMNEEEKKAEQNIRKVSNESTERRVDRRRDRGITE